MIFAEKLKLWSVDERNLDDQALMALITNKNEAALGILYDRYYRLIMTVAFHIVGDWETAEEITLDIFVTVWEKAGGYDSNRAGVRTWLTRITRNRAIDVIRREQSRPLSQSASWIEVSHEPDTEVENPEVKTELSLLKQRVRSAVATLPESQKEALWLAYFGGYSHSEIADRLNEPLGTIKTRIRSAMHKLKTVMSEQSQSDASKSNQENKTYV